MLKNDFKLWALQYTTSGFPNCDQINWRDRTALATQLLFYFLFCLFVIDLVGLQHGNDDFKPVFWANIDIKISIMTYGKMSCILLAILPSSSLAWFRHRQPVHWLDQVHKKYKKVHDPWSGSRSLCTGQCMVGKKTAQASHFFNLQRICIFYIQ